MPEKQIKPIKYVKTDRENGHLSKDEFMAKRRKQKELESRMNAYEKKALKEIEAEMDAEEKQEVVTPVEQKEEVKEEQKEEPKKRSYGKKK